MLKRDDKTPEPRVVSTGVFAFPGAPRIRHGAEAVRLAERACDLSGQREPFLLGTLAAAYAEAEQEEGEGEEFSEVLHWGWGGE